MKNPRDAVGELPPTRDWGEACVQAWNVSREGAVHPLYIEGFSQGWAALSQAPRPEPAEQWKQAYMEAMQMVRDAEAEIRELRAPRPESPAVREALVEGMRAARDGPRLTADERSAIWRTLDAALRSLPAGPRDAWGDPAAALLEVPQAPAEADTPEALLPHAYLFAKVAMMLPLFEEARDALTAITEQQRIRYGISKTLADRMDIAGTYSLDEWEAAPPNVTGPGPAEQRAKQDEKTTPANPGSST